MQRFILLPNHRNPKTKNAYPSSKKMESKNYYQKDEKFKPSYGADGTNRRKVIKNAFRVILENIIPSLHRIFLYYLKKRKDIPKEDISARLKKVKATKKALAEMEPKDKLFYEFLAKLDLNKEQKKIFNDKCDELDKIAEKYCILIKSILKSRREVLELGRVLKHNVLTQLSMLSKEQFTSFIEYFKTIEHSPFLTFRTLWEINPKKPNEEYKEDIDLTISDGEMHQDEIMAESNANLNIQTTHETKEETKQKDKSFLKAENIQHFNAPKSVISENQISKLGNYNDSQS